MSKRNPEYDFKWCPGCGDFGVRRAIEFAMIDRLENTDLPIENNVVVAGIGCSGNLVHLLEGQQPLKDSKILFVLYEVYFHRGKKRQFTFCPHAEHWNEMLN